MKKRSPSITLSHVRKSFSSSRSTNIRQFLASSEWSAKTSVIDDISLSIKAGESIGLYGINGAGKSTLLRLIAGILKPDSGIVETHGTVAPVLELGSGLHPELTGLENVKLYASILGIPDTKQDSIVPKIIEFSGLAKHIYTPVKTYSSGMNARLAFATVIFSQADIFLLDEVFAVGDHEFVDKCFMKLQEMRKKAIFVVSSHSMALLELFCDRVITIDQGKTIDTTAAIEVLRLLPTGSSFSTVIQSQSMYPLIKKGDRVHIKKAPFASLKTGELVAVLLEKFGTIVVHRLIATASKKTAPFLVSKGDNTVFADPWTVTKENYLGKVVAIESHA